jgi:D-serine deaminase-like pyridoxal phosphate-dependent protein
LASATLAPTRLQTPAVVIDRRAVARNVERLQSHCGRHGLALWPHVKSHKMVEIAAMQLAAGAAGLTCQTLGEAEVMLEARPPRVLLPSPIVGAGKPQRVAALAGRTAVTVACDSSACARELSAALTAAGAEVEVLVEYEVGLGRTGVRGPDDAARLAREVDALPGMRFAGLLAHPTPPAVEPRLAEACAAVRAAGLAVSRVSGGGTVHAVSAQRCASLTELRAGVYVLGDRATVAAGITPSEDVALTVRTTVVSRPTPTRAILDAGSKTLTSDPPNHPGLDGYGTVLEYPRAVLGQLSEEHGHLQLARAADRPAIGEVVTVLPNHACGVMNLHDTVAVHEGGGLQPQPVQARGRTA